VVSEPKPDPGAFDSPMLIPDEVYFEFSNVIFPLISGNAAKEKDDETNAERIMTDFIFFINVPYFILLT
jgi:hypothetical protein